MVMGDNPLAKARGLYIYTNHTITVTIEFADKYFSHKINK